MVCALAMGILPGPRALAADSPQITPTGQPAKSPVENVKQYMKFIDQRMNEIRQALAQPRNTGSLADVRNALEEVTRLSDELQDNLDTYDQQHVDLRKQLKDLIADSAHWSDVIQSTRSDSNYDFSRKMAMQAVSSTHDLAVKMQSSEDQFFSSHK
jgi:chromosome segregation ATPase